MRLEGLREPAEGMVVDGAVVDSLQRVQDAAAVSLVGDARGDGPKKSGETGKRQKKRVNECNC